MHTAALHDEVIDAAVQCAATLLGMEVVYFGSIDHEQNTYRFERVVGASDAVAVGTVVDFASTFCKAMLNGADPVTADAAAHPVYGGIPPLLGAQVTSYAGVPVTGPDGVVIGTLCGFDRGRVEVDDHVVGVLTELAGVISAHLATAQPVGDVDIRRTSTGWVVQGVAHESSLTSAMVLADLLADDLDGTRRPERPSAELSEVERLRASIAQLEHALAARVVVEQAIGVLAERRGSTPRDAFEVLRKVARRSGTRVHALARDVVTSVTDRTVTLPPELTRS